AKIYLVEAASNSNDDLYNAVKFAANLPGVKQISMSFGGPESAQDIADNAVFVHPGVVFFASSGDTGGVQSSPAESPNVVGVGGTNLVVSATGTVISETAWDNAGGGPSSVQSRPPFQNIISSIIGSKRGCPDISAVADPRTGASVFSTYAFGGWAVIGGTSLACPVVAGVANNRGFFKTSSVEENIRNYSRMGTASFRDITQGTAGSFSAKVGWDYITGCGSPVGLYATPLVLAPTSVAPLIGTAGGGNLASILSPDFNYYKVNSVAMAPYGIAAGASTVVPFNVADPTLVSGLSVGLVASATTNNATIQVHAWDWTKGTWILVKSFQGSVDIRTFSAALPATGDFVSGGSLKLSVRGIVPASVPVKSFTLFVDQVTVNGFVQAG
ncbi:MAG: S8 family serine peptidase, partial [Armatimonadota bacterium]